MEQENVLAKKDEMGNVPTFGYVQRDHDFSNELNHKFSNFPPIFMNFKVGRTDIGDYLREYAIENNLPKQLN